MENGNMTRQKNLCNPLLSQQDGYGLSTGDKEKYIKDQISPALFWYYSNRSVYGNEWNPEHQIGDGVLDVKDIAKYGKRLGSKVTEIEIQDGMHDLILSQKEARDATYQAIFNWLKQNQLN